jgi:carbon monoxide dehydrogenase subunit G
LLPALRNPAHPFILPHHRADRSGQAFIPRRAIKQDAIALTIGAVAIAAAGHHTQRTQERIVPMEMTGEFRIPAPRERVWQGLNDPEILKQAIPGCQTIEKLSDTEFVAKVVAKVGPVKATFGGKVKLTDLDPPTAYTISGEGTGGVAGFAKGSAKVHLDADGSEATVLHYEVQAHVGGKLAQIGSRLIDATSRKMADDFFAHFAAVVAPEQAASPQPNGAAGEAVQMAPVAVEPTPAERGTAAAGSTPTRRLSPAVWVTGLTAVVALMLYYFTRNGGVR